MELQYLSPVKYHFLDYPDSGARKEYCVSAVSGYEEFYCTSSDGDDNASSVSGSDYYSVSKLLCTVVSVSHYGYCLFCSTPMMMMMTRMVTIGNCTECTLVKTVQYCPVNFLIQIICCYRQHCHFTPHKKECY